MGNGKSWKMVLIVLAVILCEKGKNVPEIKIVFENNQEKMVKFRSWKTLKSCGKGHEKSWNFKNSKEYKSCKHTVRKRQCLSKASSLGIQQFTLFYAWHH